MGTMALAMRVVVHCDTDGEERADGGDVQPGGEESSKRPSNTTKSFTITLRLPIAGNPFFLIARAAKLRGVPVRAYIRERVIACAVAETNGIRVVSLGSLENREHVPSAIVARMAKRKGAPPKLRKR